MVSQGVRWSGWAAVAFGVVAAPFWFVFGLGFGFTDLRVVAIPVSAIVTGSVMWYIVVETGKANPEASGLAAGAVTGLLSHVLYWVLVAFREPRFLFSRIVGAPGNAFLSLLWFWWFSVPLGMAAGVVVGYLRKRSE